MRRHFNYPLVIVVLLTLFLAAATAHRVFAAPLWGDEFRTWRDGIEKPLSAVLAWTHNPDHAPLGHLLARGGAAVFGVEHAWALRLGGWLLGLACVPAIWWAGRMLGGAGGAAVGCLMALMLVVDPTVSYQITQARMYAPLLLATIVSLTLAGSILLNPERPWPRAIGLGVALAVGIWSHSQIYAVLIALLLVSLVLLARDRRTAGILLASIAIACSLGAQGIWKIAHRHDAESVEAADVTDPPGGQLEDAVNKLTGKKGITALVALASLGGLCAIARRPRGGWLVALLVGVIGMALVNLLVAARYRPVAHARYLMILQPALWLAIACLVVELWRSPLRNTLGIASGLLLAGLSVFEFTRSRNALKVHPLAEPFARATRVAHDFVEQGDRFVVVPRLPYAMYARYYGLTQDVRLDGAMLPENSPREVRTRVRSSAIGRKNVYVLCAVPPRNIPYSNVMDHPRTVAQMIAEAKEVPADPLPTLTRGEAWQAALIRIDNHGTKIVATETAEGRSTLNPSTLPATQPATSPSRARRRAATRATTSPSP